MLWLQMTCAFRFRLSHAKFKGKHILYYFKLILSVDVCFKSSVFIFAYSFENKYSFLFSHCQQVSNLYKASIMSKAVSHSPPHITAARPHSSQTTREYTETAEVGTTESTSTWSGFMSALAAQTLTSRLIVNNSLETTTKFKHQFDCRLPPGQVASRVLLLTLLAYLYNTCSVFLMSCLTLLIILKVLYLCLYCLLYFSLFQYVAIILCTCVCVFHVMIQKFSQLDEFNQKCYFNLRQRQEI